MRFENIDLARLAARLIAARKSAGLTQEEAAKHLEISRPTFILIEKGSRRPKPSEIAKLSTLYKEPLNKLLRVEQEAPVLQPHLRSAMDSLGEGAPEVSQATSILASYVDDYSQLENLLGLAVNRIVFLWLISERSFNRREAFPVLRTRTKLRQSCCMFHCAITFM